jgi:hypothetical protein
VISKVLKNYPGWSLTLLPLKPHNIIGFCGNPFLLTNFYNINQTIIQRVNNFYVAMNNKVCHSWQEKKVAIITITTNNNSHTISYHSTITSKYMLPTTTASA